MHTLPSGGQIAPFLPARVNSPQLKMTFLEQTAVALFFFLFFISVGLRLDCTDLARHNPSDFNSKIPLIHLANLQKKSIFLGFPEILLNFRNYSGSNNAIGFQKPRWKVKQKGGRKATVSQVAAKLIRKVAAAAAAVIFQRDVFFFFRSNIITMHCRSALGKPCMG